MRAGEIVDEDHRTGTRPPPLCTNDDAADQFDAACLAAIPVDSESPGFGSFDGIAGPAVCVP